MSNKFIVDQIVIIDHMGKMPAKILSESPDGNIYSVLTIMNKLDFFGKDQLRLATDEECTKYGEVQVYPLKPD